MRKRSRTRKKEGALRGGIVLRVKDALLRQHLPQRAEVETLCQPAHIVSMKERMMHAWCRLDRPA